MEEQLIARKKQLQLSMALGNVGLVHECYPQHLHKGNAKMKVDKETEIEGKQRGVNIDRNKMGSK